MAYADPQNMTINAAAVVLPRTFTGTTVGRFVSADGMDSLQVNPQVAKSGRTFRTVSLRKQKITADPLVSTTNVRVNASIRLVIDRPASGFTDTEITDLVGSLVSWLTASTNANLKKLVAGEN